MTFWLRTYAIAGLAPDPSWSQLVPARVQLCVTLRSILQGTPAEAGSPGFSALTSIASVRSAHRWGQPVPSYLHVSMRPCHDHKVIGDGSAPHWGLSLAEAPTTYSRRYRLSMFNTLEGRLSGALKVRNLVTRQGHMKSSQSVLIIQLLKYSTQALCTFPYAFPPKAPTFECIIWCRERTATRNGLMRAVLGVESATSRSIL